MNTRSNCHSCWFSFTMRRADHPGHIALPSDVVPSGLARQDLNSLGLVQVMADGNLRIDCES